ncbi:putative DNA-binding protein [Streptomyces sparsogenes DSM 40356]|uniref:Putative DNA-binding protein n=1 Tax=Streptomyces sparsogenes DSM 40356 TaxID=1331668 RepID=A0A1R1SIJ9_9ACTN|nr:putative DNA-binding protein [Streptomyces sparsogenes DSM 40356]
MLSDLFAQCHRLLPQFLQGRPVVVALRPLLFVDLSWRICGFACHRSLLSVVFPLLGAPSVVYRRGVFNVPGTEDTLVNLKELNPDASPQAAYGARLRSKREARDWTQDQLGERMGYSGRHVSAVETGCKPPTRRFSRCADTALGLTGTSDSFERAWGELRNGSLLEGFPEYVGYEAQAVEIRVFEVGIIPGLLQTPAYARALADGDVRRGTITPEQADERVAVLAERQAAVVRSRPPTMLVVMDESCIRRPVGGAEVMNEQLQHLVEVAALPNTHLQVAPYGIGERRPFNLPVYLLTMSDWSMMAYAESQAWGYLDRESTYVQATLSAYHQLQAEALSQTESVAMIEQVRKGTP